MIQNAGLVLGGFLVLVNIVAFVLVGQDKARSRVQGERFPEVYFFFLAICLASPAVLLGMFVFRHKTQKFYFPVGIGFLLVQQLALVYALWRLLT